MKHWIWCISLPLVSATTLVLAAEPSGKGAPTSVAAPAASSAYRFGDTLEPPRTEDLGVDGYTLIKWAMLLPRDWEPMQTLKGMDFASLRDSDPKAIETLARLKREWATAPTVSSLNNQRVRIPGFLVPLDPDARGLREFLLVPYFGACVHTPPPPPNQIIHVTLAAPQQGLRSMDTVWVSGVLRTTSSDTALGSSGYSMDARVVTPYSAKR